MIGSAWGCTRSILLAEKAAKETRCMILKDKVALVTGSTSGIGLAIA